MRGLFECDEVNGVSKTAVHCPLWPTYIVCISFGRKTGFLIWSRVVKGAAEQVGFFQGHK